jgi:hypothetical protein
MKKKLFLSALALAISIPALVQTGTVEASSSFSDIPANHIHKQKVDVLVDKGVISGFTDGTFKPSTKVTRGQFALFISKALELPKPTKPTSFKDVSINSAVYDGVIKAQAASIISGYPDGRLKPNDNINRGDMAIMLDRALQYKASFTNKATLTYSDKGSLGSSVVEPVQRLTQFGIMGAYSENKFSPKTYGDRISTVVAIYKLMDTKSLLIGSEVFPKGDIRNYSYEELTSMLGKQEFIRRNLPNGDIEMVDAIKDMQESFGDKYEGHGALVLTPKEYFDIYYIGYFKQSFKWYSEEYPFFEYVSINGTPFRQTQYFEPFKEVVYPTDEIIFNQIPNPPTETGKFLIDLPTKNKDVVTYHKGKLDIEKLGILVKKQLNNDYLVDVKSLFKDTNLVSVSNDGLSIQHNGKSIQLQVGSDKAMVDGQSVTLSNKVVSENGTVLVPLKSVTENVGIYWRMQDFATRFELANYPLEQNILGWGYEE